MATIQTSLTTKMLWAIAVISLLIDATAVDAVYSEFPAVLTGPSSIGVMKVYWAI